MANYGEGGAASPNPNLHGSENVDLAIQGGSFFLALFGAGVFAPFVATVTLASAYAVGAHTVEAFGVCAAVTAGLWLLCAAAFVGFTSPQGANQSSFLLFLGRFRKLTSRLKVFSYSDDEVVTNSRRFQKPRRSALRSARAYLAAIREQIEPRGPTGARNKLASGLQWLLAFGYVALWTKLERAEEAMLIVMSPAELLAEAGYDEGRLQDSKIPDRAALMYRLRQARAAIVSFYRLNPAWLHSRWDMSPVGTPHPLVWPCEATRADARLARQELARIRRAINEYRDGLWKGIVRARNRLYSTVFISTSFTLLALALVVITEQPRPSVQAGLAFFVVGAQAGLFNRLYLDGKTEKTVEDYGLSFGRLVHTPVVCGLAGLLAVLLLPFLMAFSNHSAGGYAPDLRSAFDLAKSPGNLLLAAVFGLSPLSLINRLQTQSEEYKSELRTTES